MKQLLLMHDSKFKYILIVLSLITGVVNAQNSVFIKQQLQSVIDIETSREFIKTHPELKSKLYTYNEEKHTNGLSKKLFTLQEGDTYLVEQKNNEVIYKVVSITPTKHYRASYIYLNGKKMTQTEATQLRSKLENQLNNSYEFKDLAGQYSMDRNASRGGDLGWFEENYMFPEFIDALNTHQTNDVFNLDIDNRYYLIKKTATPKNINLLTVLKVTL